MSIQIITIEGKRREQTGSKYARQLRREGFVPCNLYGGEENIHFYAPYNSFLPLVYTPEFHKVLLKIDGNEYEAIMKEISFHPVTDRILHIDFQQLIPGKKVVTEIPVQLVGRPVGVKVGGILMQKLRKLKVRIPVEELVSHIEADVTSLKLGKSLVVEELQLGNIEPLAPGRTPVASVIAPRTLRTGAVTVEEEEEEASGEATS